jgi:hypothetical protein
MFANKKSGVVGGHRRAFPRKLHHKDAILLHLAPRFHVGNGANKEVRVSHLQFIPFVEKLEESGITSDQ